jgi:hypothetical protein
MTENTLMNRWVLFALVALCWALAASFMAGYYYYEYGDLSSKVKQTIITANLGVNYGNGSATQWFNETKINAGSTLLDMTKLVTSVNSTGGLMGAINGVSNSGGKFWLWWSHSSFGWTLGSVGCDRYVVGVNETLVWYFEVYSSPPQQPP